jgi:hypothetical protein
VLIGGGAALAAGSALGRDPRVDLCPVEGNKILTTFEAARARDYGRHIPRMLRSPELEVDAVAFFVIFDGPTTLTISGAPPAEDAAASTAVSQFEGVVCAVVDGDATVYVNVDLGGMKP